MVKLIAVTVTETFGGSILKILYESRKIIKFVIIIRNLEKLLGIHLEISIRKKTCYFIFICILCIYSKARWILFTATFEKKIYRKTLKSLKGNPAIQ